MDNIFNFPQRYFNFETKNKLFDIKDCRGNYIWDIFRYEVYQSCLLTKSDTNRIIAKKQGYFSKFRTLESMLYTILPIRRENFFFLCSRNKLDKKSFDQNSYDVYKLINPKSCFLYETFSLNDYAYPVPAGTITLKNYLFKIFAKFIKVDKNVVARLHSITKKQLSDCKLDINYFFHLYRLFYFELWFYKKLFKLHSVKKIYLTQNNIQKGLFYAAKQLNIPVVEFQHGIVYTGHMAYSYPKYPEIEKKIYMPLQIVTLSDFWFSDFYLPTKKITLGNSYFSKPVMRKNNEFILVISSSTIGTVLLALIKEVAMTCSEKFIFKLHPNEFDNVEFYKTEFKSFHNVTVYTNENTLPTLLSNAKKLITVSSTCVYESIQAGVPVILYTKSHYYYMHSHILKYDGISLCSSAQELSKILNKNSIFKPSVFFVPFNTEKAKEMIYEN